MRKKVLLLFVTIIVLFWLLGLVLRGIPLIHSQMEGDQAFLKHEFQRHPSGYSVALIHTGSEASGGDYSLNHTLCTNKYYLSLWGYEEIGTIELPEANTDGSQTPAVIDLHFKPYFGKAWLMQWNTHDQPKLIPLKKGANRITLTDPYSIIYLYGRNFTGSLTITQNLYQGS